MIIPEEIMMNELAFEMKFSFIIKRGKFLLEKYIHDVKCIVPNFGMTFLQVVEQQVVSSFDIIIIIAEMKKQLRDLISLTTKQTFRCSPAQILQLFDGFIVD